MNTLTVAAGIIAVITGIVSAQAFREFSTLRFPCLLACCVAALCYIGLTQNGPGLISALLIPYSALGVSIIAMLIVGFIFKVCKRKHASEDQRKDKRTNLRRHDRD